MRLLDRPCHTLTMQRSALALTALLLATLGLPANKAWTQERREAYSSDSPVWLQAVGKLQVPSQKYDAGRLRHYKESCSASLVQLPAGKTTDTIVTAWHCLEFYSDLSRPIHFSLPSSAKSDLQYSARVLASGGGMHADWALLRLDSSISSPAPFRLYFEDAHNDEDMRLLMAGYSRDSGVGNGGATLSYDPACHITTPGSDFADTDCQAFKGASGGAVIRLDESGQPRFHGIISAGDGSSISRFVPITGLRRSLELHLP